jgi:hypothetical protein
MFDLSSPQLPFANDGDDEESLPHPGSYSTDQGNVTQVCPGIHPIYNIPGSTAANHTKEFTAAVISDEAYLLALDTAKGMAVTAWKLLSEDDFAAEVTMEFEEWKSKAKVT